MPLLDDEMLKHMRAEVKHCQLCTGQLLTNYCRQCDEFFEYGHYEGCKGDSGTAAQHKGHRTY